MPNPFHSTRYSELDGSSPLNWTSHFLALLHTRLNESQHLPRIGTRFESLFCMGNQKSGTTSFARAGLRLGFQERLLNSRHIGPHDYKRNFYQNGNISTAEIAQFETVLNRSTLFEDDPWFVLHRLADRTFAKWRRRVGYVLTVRNCADLAESSAAFNNPANGLGGNSDRWNAAHCSRHYARCHVHLLDVYNWLSTRSSPLDDVLILETAKWRSEANWHQFSEFVCLGTSRYLYSDMPRPVRLSPSQRHCLDQAHVFGSMPSANTRSKLSKARTFCPSALFEQHKASMLSPTIILNLPPVPPNHAQCARRPNLAGCKDMNHDFHQRSPSNRAASLSSAVVLEHRPNTQTPRRHIPIAHTHRRHGERWSRSPQKGETRT